MGRTQATGVAEFSDLLLLSPGLLLADARARAANLAIDDVTGDVSVSFRNRADQFTTIAIGPATNFVKTAVSGDKRYVYEDYRRAGEALQPQRISIYRGARLINRWESVAVAATRIDGYTFDLPAGYVERADRGSLRATPLGNGAYRIDGSPAHGDHVAGLPIYLKAGATALTGKGGAIALRRQFPSLPASAIEEVSAPRTLDLGGAAVILYPLRSSHAAEMLVAYSPASRTLFQGDLFYLPEVGATPATFEGGEELSRLIAAHQLDVANIVGVHGRSGSPAELADGVKLRRSAPR